MTTLVTKTLKDPVASAKASVASTGALKKPQAVAAPGERAVLSMRQTLTSQGTTPAQHAEADAAAASGSINFGSASGSISNHVLMFGALALVAYFVFVHK